MGLLDIASKNKNGRRILQGTDSDGCLQFKKYYYGVTGIYGADISARVNEEFKKHFDFMGAEVREDHSIFDVVPFQGVFGERNVEVVKAYAWNINSDSNLVVSVRIIVNEPLKPKNTSSDENFLFFRSLAIVKTCEYVTSPPTSCKFSTIINCILILSWKNVRPIRCRSISGHQLYHGEYDYSHDF